MESFALENVYFVSQTVAAIAVVISLIYVGTQVKQNTRAIKLSSAYDVSEMMRDQYAMVTTSSEVADIWLRGLQDAESLTGTDELRFYSIMHNLFRGVENVYYQLNEGALDDRLFDAVVTQILSVTRMPGFKTYWEGRKSGYSDDFQKFIKDEIIARPERVGHRFAGT